MKKLTVKAHTSLVGVTGYNAHARDFFTALSKEVNLKIRNFTVGASWKGLTNDPHEGETYLTDYQKRLIGEQTVISDDVFVDREVYNGMKDPVFAPQPKGVYMGGVCTYTGLAPGPTCPVAGEYMLQGGGPSAVCDGNHQKMQSVLDRYMEIEGISTGKE